MGSYSYLFINDYPLFSVKNGCFYDVIKLIFLEEDCVSEERPMKQRRKSIWGDIFVNDEEIETVILIKSTALHCKQRLEIFGLNLIKAKKDFEIALDKIKEQEYINKFNDFDEVNFEYYLLNIQNILRGIVKRSTINEEYLFKDYLIDQELFIEHQRVDLGLYSILSTLNDEVIIEYDLTDVFNGGWIDSNLFDEVGIEKIIVLTEGKTDIEFIKGTLEIFFPHLLGFYHFMDFDLSKSEGSASRLVHTIKAFIGAGIKNRIIAIFDNDSAALEELYHLKKIDLPSNIKVIQYPEIDLGNNYPTLGPTGIQNLNINGLAGSIELYLGRDILTENGNLIPVQWIGFKEKINKYQGVLLTKNEIQDRFRKKLKSFDFQNFEEENWSDLIKILERIFEAWD
jgi:hypothetical protein